MAENNAASTTNNNNNNNNNNNGTTSGGSSSHDEEKDKALNNSQITNSNERKLKECRVFVGNLPADMATQKGDVYDRFRKYGAIMGVSVHGRFAFVQYHTEADAKAACKTETGSEFRTARLDVKMALEGVKPVRRSPERRRSRSPAPPARRRDSRERSRDRGGRRSRDRPDSRARSPVTTYIPSPVEDRFCHPRTYGANDVEMVVIRKTQGEYADSILRRLYDRRISANMLFLAEHASLDGAVSEFGRCGTRYVITVMPKHEETRAITINMFEGDQAPRGREVRNINIDEGVNLIYRHFREHFPALARLREMELQGPGFYPAAPSEVQRTMQRMIETSAVPTSSLDATIRYLQDMRDRTAIAEGMVPQAPPMGYAQPPAAAELAKSMFTNEDTLRESVLGLLKGMVGSVQPTAAAVQPPAYAPDYASQYAGYAGATQQLPVVVGQQQQQGNNVASPAVAKALESLVTGGLLRQTTAGGAAALANNSQQAPRSSPAVHNSSATTTSIPSYRTDSQQSNKVEENGGTLYVTQQPQQSGGYGLNATSAQSSNSGGYGAYGSGGYANQSGGYAQSQQQQRLPQQQQSSYMQQGGGSAQQQQAYASYPSMQQQQQQGRGQQAYSSSQR